MAGRPSFVLARAGGAKVDLELTLGWVRVRGAHWLRPRYWLARSLTAAAEMRQLRPFLLAGSSPDSMSL